jgi:hypothetical protein
MDLWYPPVAADNISYRVNQLITHLHEHKLVKSEQEELQLTTALFHVHSNPKLQCVTSLIESLSSGSSADDISTRSTMKHRQYPYKNTSSSSSPRRMSLSSEKKRRRASEVLSNLDQHQLSTSKVLSQDLFSQNKHWNGNRSL